LRSEITLNDHILISLRKFENEVVAMAASMLHGDKDVRGNMTVGIFPIIFIPE
jgi:hypothetical protein